MPCQRSGDRFNGDPPLPGTQQYLLREIANLNDRHALYVINPSQSSQGGGGINLIIIGFVLDFTQIEISHQEVTSFSTWI